MHLPGPVSLAFLAYVLLLLPWMAVRSAQAFRVLPDGTRAQPLPSRTVMLANTLVHGTILFAFAWFAGSQFGLPIFLMPSPGAHVAVPTLVAFGACLALLAVSRFVYTEEERRSLFVFALAPRTVGEWVLWFLVIAVAGVAEEAAYRGVLMAILWHSLGNVWVAVLISAAAFSLVHWMQGWKSAAIIFVFALVMHALVQVTGTLVPAMIVHTAYNAVAGVVIARHAGRLDVAGVRNHGDTEDTEKAGT